MKGIKELQNLVADLLKEGNSQFIKRMLKDLNTLVLAINPKAGKVDTAAIMRQYIINRLTYSEKALSDYGLYGKAYEIAIRCYIMRRMRAHGMTVKGQGKTDIKFSYQGKRYTCEIKTACGCLKDAEKAQYIIYCPNVDSDFPAELQGYVFNREHWKEFITGYNGRGNFLRQASAGPHIQSFYWSETVRPTASKALTRYIESVLYDMPTVEEFFSER